MEKKVSVVVAIYNGEKYIDNCVKCLISQDYSNVEFILVDDGSTDATGNLCDLYSEKHSNIRVVHQSNGGLSAARNAGTSIATGDYIIYVDVDDEIVNNLISDNVKLAIDHDADVVFYNFWYNNLDTNERIPNKYSRSFIGNDEEFFHDVLCDTVECEIFNAPWNKMYKISFLRENSLSFLPEYPIYEDIIFASKMLQYAKKIVVNPQRYYIYYLRSSGSLLTKYVDGYFDSVTKFYCNAMDYCNMHKDNNKQINILSNLYVKLVTTNIKQISCRKNFSLIEKKARISKICESDLFKKALGNTELEDRKKIVRWLVKKKYMTVIIIMYKILGKC